MSSDLYHCHWGQGEPVVALHGLFGSMENLGLITRLLKDEFSVYGVDLPNHGHSAHVATMSLASMAEAVVAWMDSLGLAQAHFLGHSLGGKVSMEVALRYPHKVTKLIVADIAPVAYSRRHDQVFDGLRAVNLESLSRRGDADKLMQPYVAEPAIRQFLLKNLEKNQGRWQWRMNLDVLINDYDQYILGNTTEFPPFEKPVLFIKGERSDYILPEHKQPILNLFPQAAVKIIHNTEHWLHAEKPDIFTGIAKRFLSP